MRATRCRTFEWPYPNGTCPLKWLQRIRLSFVFNELTTAWHAILVTVWSEAQGQNNPRNTLTNVSGSQVKVVELEDERK